MQALWLKCQWIFVLILTGWVLSGCLGINPVTPTQFYVLNPTQYEPGILSRGDQPGSLALDDISLEVVSLHLPQYLEKPQIVTRSSENRLEFAEYNQWGGNLRKNMIRVIAQNMSRLFGTPHVAMAPFRPKNSPDFRIEVEVMRFESDEGYNVRFSCQWRLFRGKEGHPVTTRMLNLESPLPESQLNFNQIVSVMSDLLGEFCRIVGEEILTQDSGVLR